MKSARHIIGYEFRDLFRSSWLIAYTLFFGLLTAAVLYYGGGGKGSLLSLINVVLTFIPLVGLLFGTMYLYASRDFMELLLSQPVSRRVLFAGMYGGLAVPLSLAFAAGVTIPAMLFASSFDGFGTVLASIVGSGVALTLVFVAVAFVVANSVEDRVRGMSLAIVLWLGATVIYDGALLYLAHAFSEYPLELPALVLSLLNPVDLARIVLLLEFDISALMGYTGAVFEKFFGTGLGLTVAVSAFLVWIAAPLFVGWRRFRRRDF